MTPGDLCINNSLMDIRLSFSVRVDQNDKIDTLSLRGPEKEFDYNDLAFALAVVPFRLNEKTTITYIVSSGGSIGWVKSDWLTSMNR